MFRRNRNLLLRLLDLDLDSGDGLLYDKVCDWTDVSRMAYCVLVIRNRSRLRTVSFGHEAGMCLHLLYNPVLKYVNSFLACLFACMLGCLHACSRLGLHAFTPCHYGVSFSTCFITTMTINCNAIRLDLNDYSHGLYIYCTVNCTTQSGLEPKGQQAIDGQSKSNHCEFARLTD